MDHEYKKVEIPDLQQVAVNQTQNEKN